MVCYNQNVAKYAAYIQKDEIMDQSMITTAFELPGYRIVRSLGVVGTNAAGQTPEQFLEQLLRSAQQVGANAVIGVRITDWLAYGTAVVVESA